MPVVSLLDALQQLGDPRCRRGVRHPFSGIVALMLLGMLARVREMEVLVRWATLHWDQLREPLGFDRDTPPCATTISRIDQSNFSPVQRGGVSASVDNLVEM